MPFNATWHGKKYFMPAKNQPCFKVGHEHVQTDVRRRAFSVHFVEQWNSLPVSVVTEQDYQSFKSKLAAVLGDKLFWHPP